MLKALKNFELEMKQVKKMKKTEKPAEYEDSGSDVSLGKLGM